MHEEKSPQLDKPGGRGWLVDVLVGGGIGAVVGAIGAVNFVIFIGTEEGYQTSIPEVFEYHVAAGIITVAILMSFPVAEVWLARRRRRRL